jgi:hypothetical protein
MRPGLKGGNSVVSEENPHIASGISFWPYARSHLAIKVTAELIGRPRHYAEVFMGGAIVIPLVALLFPILLLVVVVALDAAFISWIAYQVWHVRAHARQHGRIWRAMHRAS